MDTQDTMGFTIIELTLVLAIISLLISITIIGTGAMISTTRFTDSARSLHAYVQKRFDDIVNGFNPRHDTDACNSAGDIIPSNQTPGTSSCILMGKVMIFSDGASKITTYDVIGLEPNPVDYNKSDEELIHDFQPRIITAIDVRTFEIPWEAQITGSKRLSDGIAVDAFAMLRSPRSTRIVMYAYKEPPSSYALADLIDPSVAANANTINATANFCLASQDDLGTALAKIMIIPGQSQDAIGLDFNAVTGDCDGA